MIEIYFLYLRTNELKLQYFCQLQAKFNYSSLSLREGLTLKD